MAGLLSAGVVLLHSRSVSNSYDDAMRQQLAERAIAYGETAMSFLDAAGPNALSVANTVVTDTIDETEAGEEPTTQSAFYNAFLAFEVWATNPQTGQYESAIQHAFQGGAKSIPEQDQALLVYQAGVTQTALAVVDDKTEQILLAVPIQGEDGSDAVIVGVLSIM